jgi:serralysin
MTIALTDQFDQDILALVNQERSSRGLGILTLSQKLDTAADLHAQDMATNYYATNHTGSDSSTTATRITRSGYEWTSIGENLAAGYTSASSVVQAWMNSTGHRANILNPNFTDLGLGYTYLSGTGGTANNYKHYWALELATGDSDPGNYDAQEVNQINGPNSNNNISGTTGGDIINGGSGNDTISGGGNDDYLVGGLGNDTLSGGLGNDTLSGSNGNDSLNGGLDNDVLVGGPGLDTLTGGSGSDAFSFESWGQGLDTITDFNVIDDTIRVAADVFAGGLTVGTLNSAQLVIGSVATSANQRFIYNSSNGALSFDADGNGSGTARLFATLSPGLSFTNTDIVVF